MINPEEVFLKTLPQADTIASALENFIFQSLPTGISGKTKLLDLINFITPFIPAAAANPFVANTGSPLPNPISKGSAITFVGAGTFDQTTGADIVTTQPLNVLFWTSNGTTGSWSLGLAIAIDLSGYLTITAFNTQFSTTTEVLEADADMNKRIFKATFLDGSQFPFNQERVGIRNFNYLLQDRFLVLPTNDYLSFLNSSDVDKNGRIFNAKFSDGSELKEKIRITDLYREVKDGLFLPYISDALAEVYLDKNNRVLRATFKDGTPWPYTRPAITATASIQKDDLRVNLYPNVYQKLKRTMALFAPITTEFKPFTIVMFGDSHFARETHTSAGPVIPYAYPPGATTNNLLAYLFRNITGLEVPKYSRYDTPSGFTESGAFTTLTGDATNWDDDADRPCETRISTAVNASFSRIVPAGFDGFNLIDRADALGDTAVVVSTPGGNGLFQVKLANGTWVEANNFSFSQRYTDLGSGWGNTQYQRRTQFKKIGAAIGQPLTVTFTKGNNSDRLLYWGFEEVTGQKQYVQILNLARGGHDQADLNQYRETDIFERKPNLVLYEFPFSNEAKTKATMVTNITNFIWNGANSLKTRSNSWVDFEVLCYLPHLTASGYNSDGSLVERVNGHNNIELMNAVKGVFVQQDDVAFVDASSIGRLLADRNFSGNNNVAFGGSSITGTTYTTDGTHLNDLGVKEISTRILVPIFQFTSY